MKLSKLASAMPFAHYLGLSGSAAAAAEEDEERKQKDGESDDDYAKRMEKMDEEEEAARKAEEEKKEEEARKAEEEKKEEEARARRAKKAEQDEDDDEMEDEGDDEEAAARPGRAKAARQRERIRCARIVAAGIKAGRVNQACAFAFDTKLSASQAISALNAGALDAPARRSGLGERMSTVTVPNPGTNTGAAAQPKDPAAAAAARIVAAGERARGSK